MTPARLLAVERFAAEREALVQSLWSQPSGREWCHRHTRLYDRLVRTVASWHGQHHFTVIATGGYGRRELSPKSDIDLTVMPADETNAAVETAIRGFFTDLDTVLQRVMGTPFGYAYRLLSDVPGLDSTTRTGLFDMRRLSGPSEPSDALRRALLETLPVAEFLRDKFAERESAFRATHGTPLVVEPDVKTGAGGLRCGQIAAWVSRALGQRVRPPSAAYETVLRHRNLLHAVSTRHPDQFTRSRQAEIADRLGTDIYRLMSAHAEAADALHGEYTETRRRVETATFQISPGVRAIRGEIEIAPGSELGRAAAAVAVGTQIGLRVQPKRLPPSPLGSGASAMFALGTSEAVVRHLDTAGLLAHLLPELTACRTLMPRDTVHRFTVYEHTLQLLRHLDEISDGYLLELRDGLVDRKLLYFGCLLHDVGKLHPERPHSEVGAEMAREIAARWQLESSVADQLHWMVLEHLSMARLIRMRDLMHPDTSREFATVVKTPQRLALLTLLTYADIRAVSPESWTPAMASFLQLAYESTLAVLMGDAPNVAPDSADARRHLLRTLAKEPAESVRQFVDSLPAYYLASTPAESIRLHRVYAERAHAGQLTIDFVPKPHLAASELTVCAPDSAGLLSRLLGVVYAFDHSLLAVRAATTRTVPAIAIDTFLVSFNGRPVPSATAVEMERALRTVIESPQQSDDLLRARGKDPTRAQRYFSYTFRPGNPALLEIRAPRGRGMPYRFSRHFAELGWNVVSARVGQWAGSAAASFYLAGAQGQPLTEREVRVAMDALTLSQTSDDTDAPRD
jgi:[protein-PII] uridylyltransferase